MPHRFWEAVEKQTVWGALGVGVALLALSGWVYTTNQHVLGVGIALGGVASLVFGIAAFGYWFSRVEEEEQVTFSVTPVGVRGMGQEGGGRLNTFLRVTNSGAHPLRNCRVRISNIEEWFTYVSEGQPVGYWAPFQFLAGMSFHCRWSGHQPTVDAIDITHSEDAEIAEVLSASTRVGLRTTTGAPWIWLDYYRMNIEVISDNGPAFLDSFCLHMVADNFGDEASMLQLESEAAEPPKQTPRLPRRNQKEEDQSDA